MIRNEIVITNTVSDVIISASLIENPGQKTGALSSSERAYTSTLTLHE